MEKKINTPEEMRIVAVVLNSNINQMCNATNIEEVSKAFVEAKDNLVALFKFNVERVQK